MSPVQSQGSPNKGGQNQKWLPHTCLLGGPQVGGNAASTLHSGGSPNKGGQNQKWGHTVYCSLLVWGSGKKHMCCGLKKKPIPKKHPSICHKVKGYVWGAVEKGLRNTHTPNPKTWLGPGSPGRALVTPGRPGYSSHTHASSGQRGPHPKGSPLKGILQLRGHTSRQFSLLLHLKVYYLLKSAVRICNTPRVAPILFPLVHW